MNPFVLTDPRGLSLEVIVFVGSENLSDGSSEDSIRFKDGTSPLQYLLHMFRYDDSRPRVNFEPSQRGDLDMRRLRSILKFERAVMSEANCSANLT